MIDGKETERRTSRKFGYQPQGRGDPPAPPKSGSNARWPSWIPVNERLPKLDKYVLVRFASNDMAVACYFNRDEDMIFWRAMTDDGWYADCDNEPTHWMPLPEPPKEET